MDRIKSYFSKNKLFILMLVFFMSFWGIIFHLVINAHAATLEDFPDINSENSIVVTETGTEKAFDYGYYYLLYPDGSPITIGDIINGNTYITVFPSDGGTWKLSIYSPSYSSDLTVDRYQPINSERLSYISNLSSEPLRVTNYGSKDSRTWTFRIYNSPVTVEPTDPSEPTEPSEPDDPIIPPDDPTDNTGLLDGIKVFFAELFSPITDLFDTIGSVFSEFTIVGEIFDKIYNGNLFIIFENFMDSLDTGAIMAISKIWELPIISELLIVFVFILIFSGIITLCLTL